MGTGTGSADTILVVIRGNSGAGKSTVAERLRAGHGRGCALVGQDYFRRVVLRERDKAGGLAPLLLDCTVRLALDHGYHVILEGILSTPRYGQMLTSLVSAHRGRTSVWYLDASLEETFRRHSTRPLASEFGMEELRSWYAADDLLGVEGEHVVPASSTLEQTVATIAQVSGLPQDGLEDDYLPFRS